MATIVVPFGAFTESPNKAFVQSPNKARKESGVSWNYTTTRLASFAACHTRPYPSWGYSSLASSRTVFDEVFLRQRRIWENGAVEGGEYDKFDSFTNLNSGTPPDLTGYTDSTETLNTDSASTIIVDGTLTGSGLPDITFQDIWDTPYTYAQMLVDVEAIYDDKFAAWSVASPTNEFWKYDSSGSIVDDSAHTQHGGLPAAGVYWEDLNVIPDFDPNLRIVIHASKYVIETSPSIATQFRVTEERYIAGSLDDTVIREPIADGDMFLVEPTITGAAPYGGNTLSVVSITVSKAASQPP